MTPVLELDDDSYATFLMKAPRRVLIETWAPSCGPCVAQKRATAEIARELAGRWTIVRVNAQGNPKFAKEFRIRAVPTLLLMHRGQEVKRIIGGQTKTELLTELEQAESLMHRRKAS